MRTGIPDILTLSFLIAASHSAPAQDSTIVSVIDSVQNKILQITPYYSQPLRSSGSYIKIVDDPDLFRLSSGISVFNVLRGQVPGLILPAYAPWATVGLRASSYGIPISSIIIDGILYNNQISGYSPLNSIDYSSITSISSPNAMTLFDISQNGAFVLLSKTGRGVTTPTIEFNSYTTAGRGVYNSPPKMDWYLANTLAYAQDFGAVDARISYNILSNPTSPDVSDGYTPIYHNVKVSLGTEIGKKVDLRLILDNRYHQGEFRTVVEAVPPPGPPRPVQADTIDQAGRLNFLQGNLILKYNVLEWLQLSSQMVFTKLDSSGARFSTTYDSETENNQQRHLVNGFVNVQKNWSNSFVISGFAGIQYHKQQRIEKSWAADSIGTLTNKEDWELESPSVSTGFEAVYKKLVSIALQYRLNEYNNSVVKSYQKPNFSAAASFVFSELFTTDWLSFGKIRAGFGENYSHWPSGFPQAKVDDYLYINKPTRNRALEFGTDFSLLNSRFSLSLNYFKNKIRYNVANVINTAKGIISEGWEADIDVSVIQKTRLTHRVKVLLSTFKSKFDLTGPGEADYSAPGWKNCFVSQLDWKNARLSFFIESIKAGNLYTHTNFVKLRDVSLSYGLPKSISRKVMIKDLRLSISGRNLFVFRSDGFDFEEYSLYVKSASISLSAVF